MLLGREMVLATVGLVIVEGICDACQKTHPKGFGNMNHFKLDEDLPLWKNNSWRFGHYTAIFIYEPVAPSPQGADILQTIPTGTTSGACQRSKNRGGQSATRIILPANSSFRNHLALRGGSS
jgi:hypothetical protein